MQTPDAPAPVSWQEPQKPTAPGAAGFVYADIPNRVVALIVDIIIVGILYFAVALIVAIAGFSAGVGATRFDAVSSVVFGVALYAVSFAYFWYTWTRNRATFGMRMLGMQVGNAFDGRTLTSDQAIRRALALWGPGLLSTVFSGAPAIGPLVSLFSLLWGLYLLYTTYSSPTKQGFHDKFANSVVVKATRVA